MNKKHFVILVLLLALFGYIFKESQALNLLFHGKETPQVISSPPKALNAVNTEINTQQSQMTIADENRSADENYIVKCELDEDKLNSMYPQKAMEEKFTNMMADLQQAKNLDSQLAYALYSKESFAENNTKNIELLKRVFMAEPTNALAMTSLLQECADLENALCDQNIEKLAIQHHNDNGYLWFLIGNKRIKLQDKAGAISAFNKMISAPYFDEMFADYIDNFMNISGGYNIAPSSLRSIMVFGMAAARKSPSFSALTQFCKTISAEDLASAYLCLDIGKTLENSSKLALFNLIGFAMQENVYQKNKDEKALAALQIRKENSSFIKNYSKAAYNLMIFDEKLHEHWLNTFKNKGETAASKALNKEAVLLSKNKNYYPCNNLF
ncbi:MAG: hypothetical protein COB35_04505 [Gammaproteobacteria bacterium]|nr:MAG: hypothetical protein COB35_04505 [Gammaproteobacteria bacterium]